MQIKNESSHKFTESDEILIQNYVKTLITGNRYISDLITLCLSSVLMLVTITYLTNNGHTNPVKYNISTVIYAGIIAVAIVQILEVLKRIARRVINSQKFHDKDYTKLVIYDGIIKGYPVENHHDRVLVSMMKPLKEIDEQEQLNYNIQKDKKGNSNNLVEEPNTAFMATEFALDLPDDTLDNSVKAYIIELLQGRTREYFAYPAHYFNEV